MPRQPEPQPDEVPYRAQDRDEAGARPHPGDPRVMIHRHLPDAQPAAPALEIQLGVEQGRARQQEISDSELLRVLQEREFERLGSLRTLRKAMMLVAVGG